MMTSKERALRAIEGRRPDKVPMWVYFSMDPYNKKIAEQVIGDYPGDIILIERYDPDFKPIAPGCNWLGYKMESFGETFGEVKDPPLENWDNFDQWRAHLPDFTKPACYERCRQVRKDHPDKFLVGGLGLMMEELINLRGYANYMMDFYDEEERLGKLIDVIYELAVQSVDGYADAGFDAVIAWEDWGLQNSPMISYEMWDRFFHKKMRAFVEHIHSRGMKYILHSCGHIAYLMDAFADMGIDVLQLDQQMNIGLDTLAKWQGKFCFCCPTDIQHVVSMSETETQAYIHEMQQKLGNTNGGFIFKPYAQPAAIRMPVDKLRLELETANHLFYPNR